MKGLPISLSLDTLQALMTQPDYVGKPLSLCIERDIRAARSVGVGPLAARLISPQTIEHQDALYDYIAAIESAAKLRS